MGQPLGLHFDARTHIHLPLEDKLDSLPTGGNVEQVREIDADSNDSYRVAEAPRDWVTR